MEEKHNESTINRPEGERPIDAPVVLIDIANYIEQLKSEKAWDENDRNAIAVFKSDKLRIVIVALHKDAEMHTEHPENILSIQIIKGKIKVYADDKTTVVKKDELVIVHENIPYKIQAMKKSVFLLTVVQ